MNFVVQLIPYHDFHKRILIGSN